VYAIGQVRIESRQNILDLPEVFIPAEETAFVVSNGFIVEEDGRYAVVRKSPAGRHTAPDGCSVLVEYESDYQFCRIVPLTEVVIALNALDAARKSVEMAGRLADENRQDLALRQREERGSIWGVS